MRFYVYISDDKVKMLAAQVGEGRLRRISRALDITVDLRLFGIGASVKAGSPQPSDASRVDLLRVVERSIDDDKVGPVDSDLPWIRGSMGLRWGFVDPGQRAMCFTACGTDQILVLGGSAKHLIGGVDVNQQSHHAYSMLPVLLATLLENVQPSVALPNDTSRQIEAAAALATTANGPDQEFEFLARRLFTGTDRQGRRVVLASPLFVAMEG